MRKALLLAVAILLLVLPETLPETECWNRISRVASNQAGELVDDATVAILNGSDSIASAKTGRARPVRV